MPRTSLEALLRVRCQRSDSKRVPSSSMCSARRRCSTASVIASVRGKPSVSETPEPSRNARRRGCRASGVFNARDLVRRLRCLPCSSTVELRRDELLLERQTGRRSDVGDRAALPEASGGSPDLLG